MKPASTTRSTPRSSSQSPSAASRSVAVGAESPPARTRPSRPRPPRPARARAPRRGSTPRRRPRCRRCPWTVSSSAWRFDALARDQDGDAERHVTPPGAPRAARDTARSLVSRRPPLDQLVDAREDVRPAHVRRRCRRRAARRRSCARSSCCARRGGSRRRSCAPPPGRAAGGDRDDRVVEVGDLDRVGQRRDRARARVHTRRSTAPARRAAAAAGSPKWRRIARPPAGVLLDVGPDLAVLAPARPGAPPRPTCGRAPRRGGRSGPTMRPRRGRARTATARSPPRA